MKKQFKVFISSTTDDLKEARKRIQDTLLAMDCIPENMENFWAADVETWDYIKNVLSECDYFIIVIAARYGSIYEKTGKSFIQMEYEYAKVLNIPIGRFVYENPEELPFANYDKTEELQKKFNDFRAELQHGQIVKYWRNLDQLCCLICITIHQFIVSDIENLLYKNNNLKIKIDKMKFTWPSWFVLKFKEKQNNTIIQKNYINNNIEKLCKVLNRNSRNYINDNIEKLSEVSNIILSAGTTSFSIFLGIEITVDLIKPSIIRNGNSVQNILGLKNSTMRSCRFTGVVKGEIVIAINNKYLELIKLLTEENYPIDLTNCKKNINYSLYDELGNMFFSTCITALSEFGSFNKLEISYKRRCVNFKPPYKKTYIFRLKSKNINILTSYLILNEDEVLDILDYIRNYEKQFIELSYNK